MGRLIFPVGILTVLLSISTAYGYRAAKVASDQAEMKEAPSEGSPTKSVLSRGARVNTSDQPANGYYRARSSTDTGWIRESDLDFAGAPQPQTPNQPQTQGQQPVTRKNGPERMEDKAEQNDGGPTHWAAKLFGGIDFWKASEVSNVIGSTALQTGSGFGGEIDYWYKERWAFAFRLEKLTKSASGPTGSNGTGDVVDLQLSSAPVMLGMSYAASRGENFSLDIGAYLGLAFSTQVTETDPAQASPNTSQLSATAPTFLLAGDLNWHITDPLWLFAELGYRYLKTSQGTPTNGNGSLFADPTTKQPVPFAIDLSGPVLNFGIRLNF